MYAFILFAHWLTNYNNFQNVRSVNVRQIFYANRPLFRTAIATTKPIPVQTDAINI